jgi:hypothetical protein
MDTLHITILSIQVVLQTMEITIQIDLKNNQQAQIIIMMMKNNN